MSLRPSLTLFAGLALAVISCSAGRSSELDTDGSSSGTGAGTGTDTITISTGGNTGTGGASGCSEAAKLIYVVGVGNELYSFAPQTLTFQQIGLISCPAAFGATPFSMAVERSGRAWVLFDDGTMFNVETATAACTATSYVPNQVGGFDLFGMGFVSDAPGSSAETLYVGSFWGVGIGRIDLATLTLTQVGTYNLLNDAAEITGTGDARLYGFFSGINDTVAEINKANSQILTQYHPNVEIGDAWAFAFWGGSFWLFTNPGMMGSSQVDRFDPVANTTTTEVSSVGFRIVGAGVSTCAPITPPR